MCEAAGSVHRAEILILKDDCEEGMFRGEIKGLDHRDQLHQSERTWPLSYTNGEASDSFSRKR